MTDHPLDSIGADPISADRPCGENVRYETEFEHLEAELAKQESLSSETVDWKVVADLSSEILKAHSKDLLVGSYLCNALLLKDGYGGLALGLKILHDMIDQYWDDLFPPAKRMRARATALTWLAEKAGAEIAAKPPAPADAAAVMEAADRLKKLDRMLVDKMGDEAPMLTDLATPLKNYQQSAAAEAAKAGTAKTGTGEESADSSVTSEASLSAEAGARPQTPATAPGAATAPSVEAATKLEAGVLESEADTKKLLRQVQAVLRETAAFWIGQNLSDIRAYRLGRLAVWMVIDNAPPDNNGITQINPPAAERLKYFEVQREKAEYESLIPELEKTLARSPFWLDGHFEVVKALRGLGSDYEAAAQTVIRELGCFLSRLPEVINLSFMDESSFASDPTRLWLDAEVLGQSNESSTAAASAGPADEPWSIAFAEAKQLVAGGENDKAISLMQAGLANSGQTRDQVLWRCALAELLLQTGKADAAAAILESVGQQMQARQLADWEPQLLARIYNLLYQSYQKQQKSKKDDKSLREKTEQAFEQLCWFDPVTALSVKGG